MEKLYCSIASKRFSAPHSTGTNSGAYSHTVSINLLGGYNGNFTGFEYGGIFIIDKEFELIPN